MPFIFLCILFLDEIFNHVLESHGPRTLWAKNHVIYCSQMQIKMSSTKIIQFILLSLSLKEIYHPCLYFNVCCIWPLFMETFFLCLFFRKNKEDFLRNLARDNAQLLFNAIWKVRLILLIFVIYTCRVLLVSVFSLVVSSMLLILNCIIIYFC